MAVSGAHEVSSIQNWDTSSYSKQHGDCIEIGSIGNIVGVRDTKNRGGGVLVFDHSQWSEFVHALHTDFPT